MISVVCPFNWVTTRVRYWATLLGVEVEDVNGASEIPGKSLRLLDSEGASGDAVELLVYRAVEFLID